MATAFRPGDVISYPYLWRRQAIAGEDAGRKNRPVCVAIPIERNGETHVFLLPITGTPPIEGQGALEIPTTELFRIKLSEAKQGWIIVNEGNYEIVERSFYLEPHSTMGRFSEAFVKRIAAAFRAAIVKGQFNRVDRTE